MSKAEPKGGNLLRSLKKEIVRGGAAGNKVSARGSRGAPWSVQKQTKTLPGSENPGIVKIEPFLNENIGFYRSGGAPGGSGRAPEGCLGEHFGAPWIPRGPLRVPGYQFGAPWGPSGDNFWFVLDPQGSFGGRTLSF